MREIFFVYGSECEDLLSGIEDSKYASFIKPVSVESFLESRAINSSTHVIICGSTDEIKSTLKMAVELDFSVSFLAQKNQDTLRSTFEIPKKLEEALQIAIESDPKPLDMLYVNDEVILWGALVGDAPPLTYSSSVYTGSSFKERYKLLIEAFKKLKDLKQHRIKLTTAKEQEINTSATGIVIIEHDNHTSASKLVKEHLSVSDGKLSALLLSPTSITDYLYYLYLSLFKRVKNISLPDSVGFIKSESLEIESTPPLRVMVDGVNKGETPVKFMVKREAIRVSASEKFWDMSRDEYTDKETVKLSGLPTTNESIKYAQDTLPLFTHASEERYRELFADLRVQAKLDSTYMILMVLSTILATVGLFLNSASVVIGAMLLAPLMQPIVSNSMGVLRRDESLFFNSLKTVLIGIFLTLFSAAFIALILPLENLTDEINARLSPSLLDLMVALASGVAAAYAKNNEKIVGSLAGVSIAVALVPPLATAGIGLGWMNFNIFYQAFLLFLTNFVGIIFAASITFLVMGYAPIKRAKKGLFLALGLSIIIAIPLYFSFKTMALDSKIRTILEQKSYMISGKEINIENVSLTHTDILIIKCDFIVEHPLSGDELREFKSILESRLDKRVSLEVIQRVKF